MAGGRGAGGRAQAGSAERSYRTGGDEQLALASAQPVLGGDEIDNGQRRRWTDTVLVFTEDARVLLEARVGGWHWVKPAEGDG